MAAILVQRGLFRQVTDMLIARKELFLEGKEGKIGPFSLLFWVILLYNSSIRGGKAWLFWIDISNTTYLISLDHFNTL